MPINEPGELLTVREVAHFLRVSESRVYQLINDGRLPASNVGVGSTPRFRIRREDAIDLTMSNRGPTAHA